MDTAVYYIWLSLRCGAGSEAPSFLLSHFSTPKDIYEADEDALARALPGRAGLVASLCDKDIETAQRVYDYCLRANVGIITLESPLYPERLRSIHAKPIVLYFKGTFPDVDKNVLISCVGTRKCSEKGARLAYTLGADLAAAGAIVVSGMALGIDTMCARGALSAGGRTIAVLGCGIDRVYPQENKELMRDIMEHGAVITEYAPGMVPNGKHFPVRNRIISGLSLGTVVVEAGRGSGALITAEHAGKQGRDVFAVPGDVDNKFYMGTNDLISEGAKMVRSAADILSEYESVWRGRIFTENIHINKYRGEYNGGKKENIPPKAPMAVNDYSAEAEKKKTPFSLFRKKDTGKKPRVSDEDFIRAHEEAEMRGIYEEVLDFSELPIAADAQSEGMAEGAAMLEGFEKTVYENIRGTLTSDEIAAAVAKATGAPADTGAVLGALTSLEIEGLCESLPGGLFKKI
ncbi:MAG: DNA-processing protein DprA [Clostridia bacterium]|nr:DNA-processing protein DprA [Clostridia bacterium]